jgi:hypothetical protein
MNETIRDYLKRRIRWLMAAVVGGWLLFPLSAAVPRETRPLVLALGGILFGGAILAINYLIKCPRCSAKVGQTIAMPLAFSWGSGPRINFCPYCGVSLDQPRTQQQHGTATNPIS